MIDESGNGAGFGIVGMTALEEIKKALKKVYIAEWYISGVKTNGLSVVHNAADSSMFGITAETFEAEYLVAVNPAAISELLSTLESLQRENEELRDGLRRIKSRASGCTFVKGQGEELLGQRVKFLEKDIRDIARTALASTGGEHNGN